MKYFAYGSNMLKERITSRVASANNPMKYALRKYRLRFHKNSSADCSGKCNIIETALENDIVHGVIYDIADDDISKLDAAEGRDYRRKEMICVLDGVDAKVSFYVAKKHTINESLMPYRWYYDLVLAGAQQQALPCRVIVFT